MDEVAIGSSSTETIRGSARSKNSLDSVTATFVAENRRAVSAASRQLVVLECGAPVADRIGRPGFAVQPHQSEKQTGVEAAAQQQSDGHVAQQMPLQGALVDVEKLFLCLPIRLGRREGMRPEPIPALDPERPVLEDRHRAGRELAHALVQRQRGRRVSIPEEQVEGGRIDWRPAGQSRENRAKLGPEDHRPAFDPVVDELDAHGIAGEDEPLAPLIPDRQAEHAIQPVKDFCSPLLVAVDNDLRVGTRTEDVSGALEFLAQLREVVDLAIKHDPDRLVLVGHRLMTAREVDNRETTESESQAAGVEVALVVRPPVRDGRCHCAYRGRRDGSLVGKVVLAADAAHGSRG